MRLLLVNPYFEGTVPAPSLGLGFIGTYIKNHSDCEVKIVEPVLQGLSKNEVLIKTKKSDVVGLTCYTESRFQCFDFAREVKEINPGCKLVVGGPHATALDEEILKHYPFVDAVVRGEGEETTLDIVKKKPFAELSGITWRDKEKVIRNPARPLIKNIDYLDYDYSLIFSQIKGWKDFEIPQKLQKVNNIPFIASRGCPFQCSFCAAPEHWSRTWRGLTVEELIKRMGSLVNQYKVRYFRFYDALFIGSDERILEFCDQLERSKLKVSFRIDIRVGTGKDTLKRLREVGCDVVGFGVESGSDKILKRINKGITGKQIEETIKICQDLDYWMIGFFMISLPNETKEDFKKTLSFFKHFNSYNLQFFKIYPHTSFYQELKEKGEIDDEVWFDKRYGKDIVYSKDIFAKANFYQDEVEWTMGNLYYGYNICHPGSTIRKVGLAKAIFILPALALITMLRLILGRRIYEGLRDTLIFKRSRILFRRLLEKVKIRITS